MEIHCVEVHFIMVTVHDNLSVKTGKRELYRLGIRTMDYDIFCRDEFA